MSTSVESFAELGLSEGLLKTLSEIGYETPSPIQAQCIPILLEGRDLIGQAQTGTGKTAAFALPLMEQIDVKLTKPQALVLTPTRELAIQVAEALQSYARPPGPDPGCGRGDRRQDRAECGSSQKVPPRIQRGTTAENRHRPGSGGAGRDGIPPDDHL